MLFRPSYCANCGEKIEREEWHLWTSRRFCELCETQYKGMDLIPRVIVVVGTIAAVAGSVSYLRSGPVAPEVAAARPYRSQQDRQVSQTQGSVPPAAPVPANSRGPLPGDNGTANVSPRTLASTAGAQPPTASSKTADGEATYYCGARTKKGTPCTRRVKGNVRCYQHLGMPAMLPPEKLRIG